MTTPEPRSHPKIVTSLRRTPGRYRTKTDPGTTPTAPPGSLVRVDVGNGLRTEDLPNLLAYARQVRGAGRLEILGRSQRAVDEARKAFLAAWEADDGPAIPGGNSAGAWAALMLAHVPKPDGRGSR